MRPMRKARRNDSPWRKEVLAKRGQACRRCGRSDGIQSDHIKPRSQGGTSVVENGLPLCMGCHRLKTEHRILVDKRWLDDDQVDWLRDVGWVWWDDDGEVYGPGRKSFARERRAH